MSELKKNELKSETVIEKSCKHFVQRRKRFCRMTVAKGQVIFNFSNFLSFDRTITLPN